MILFLHHRYRAAGGEEAAANELAWLVRTHLGEDAELLSRDSTTVGRVRAAAGLLRGGLDPDEVARAVRRTNARIVHAHNLHPTFGWRALAAARSAGARVVLHLHQYRLVCAIGVCFRDGHECTRCHGRNTLPGVVLNCRGSVPEALTYGAGLALWQRRLAANVDAFVVPSQFAQRRLRELAAPVPASFVVRPPIREPVDAPGPAPGGYALITSRLVPEKGIDVAIEACRIAGISLVIAGEGPERSRLERPPGTSGPDVRFVGQVAAPDLPRLRAGAAVALVPSRVSENLSVAAAEALASGLPVAASRVGGLPELIPDEWLTAPGDPRQLAATISRIVADPGAGARALDRARAVTAPERVAPMLAAAYEHALARR